MRIRPPQRFRKLVEVLDGTPLAVVPKKLEIPVLVDRMGPVMVMVPDVLLIALIVGVVQLIISFCIILR